MSALAIRSNSNLNFQNSPEEPVQNRPRDIRVLPHHYFGSLNIPGIFNLFYVPSDLKATLQDQYQAEKLGDIEGSYDNWLRLFEMPFNVSSSVFSTFDFVVKILSYFKINPNNARMLSVIGKGTPIFGLIVCAFESAMEIRGLTHAHSMLKLLDLPKSFEALKNNPDELDKAILHSLDRLNQEYCEKDPYLERRIQALVRRKFPRLSQQGQEEKARQYEQLSWGARDRSLIRRVYPRCAQKVHEMVPQLLQEFSRISPEDRPAWRTRACELLTDVKIQSYKKTLMHVLGLLAVLITVAALIAMLCACPYVIPMVLLIIGGVLSTVRLGVSEGMMNTQGYKFDPYNLIPDYIKAIYQKIFKRSLQPALQTLS